MKLTRDGAHRVIEAEEFILRDPQGRKRARMFYRDKPDDAGPVLSMFDAQGGTTLTLCDTGSPGERGGPGIFLFGDNAAFSVYLDQERESVHVTVEDGTCRNAVDLRVDAAGVRVEKREEPLITDEADTIFGAAGGGDHGPTVPSDDGRGSGRAATREHCVATTKSGRPCTRKAHPRHDSGLCSQHEQIRLDGKPWRYRNGKRVRAAGGKVITTLGTAGNVVPFDRDRR